jgi:hypothetical protein
VILGVVVGVCVCVFLLGWVSGTWGVDHHHHLRSFILSFDIVSVCQARKLFFFLRNLSFLCCVVFSFCPFCWFFWSEEGSALLGGRKGVLGGVNSREEKRDLFTEPFAFAFFFSSSAFGVVVENLCCFCSLLLFRDRPRAPQLALHCSLTLSFFLFANSFPQRLP